MKKHIVVLSGAGVSAESGMDTFRDTKGLWQQYDWRRMGSIEGWEEEPEVVLDFYNKRRKDLLEVQPNQAHRLLAELEQWYDVSIITQNVDNLHERAGSTHVLHLHGELTKVTSSQDRDRPDCVQELPLDIPLAMGDKAVDGSQLRPYVVWFGEAVPMYELAIPIVRRADVLIVIGTSLTVYPAAGLLHFAPPTAQKYIINPGMPYDPYDTHISDNFEHIKEKATVGMAILKDILLRRN
jgi:NAD-dependent deacetylase